MYADDSSDRDNLRRRSWLGEIARFGRRVGSFAVLTWIFLSFPQNALAQVSFRGGPRTSSGPAKPAIHTEESFGAVSGPLLGYVFDPDQRQLRTISGIPGAAVTGPEIDLGRNLSRIQISPRHDYALGIETESDQLLLADLARRQFSIRPVPGFAAADRITFSPKGTSAALYYRGNRLVQIVSGLPANPFKKSNVDLSTLPGVITALAVSGDGAVLLAATAHEQGGALLAFTESAGASHVAPVGNVTSMSFVPDSRDILIADYGRNEIVLIRDVAGTAAPRVLADKRDGVARPIGVGVSSDGRRAFAANKASDTVLTVDLDGGGASLTPCRCLITVLRPLLGNGVFLLSEASDSPLYVFDGRAKPRTVFVPNSGATQEANSLPRRLPRGRPRR